MSEELPLIVGGRRGRPPRAGVRATERVAFFVTESERAELSKVANLEHKPLASMIREAVNSYVSDFGGRVVFTPSGDRFRK